MAWRTTIKITHLLTEDEDWETTQKNMNAIADVLDASLSFTAFNTSSWRKIPKGDEFFSPVDYANKLLDRMYDYADQHRIWVA